MKFVFIMVLTMTFATARWFDPAYQFTGHIPEQVAGPIVDGSTRRGFSMIGKSRDDVVQSMGCNPTMTDEHSLHTRLWYEAQRAKYPVLGASDVTTVWVCFWLKDGVVVREEVGKIHNGSLSLS